MNILFGGKFVRIRNYVTEIRHFSPLFLLFCRHFPPLFLLFRRHFSPLFLFFRRHFSPLFLLFFHQFPPLFLLFCRYLNSFNAATFLAFSLAMSKVNICHYFSKQFHSCNQHTVINVLPKLLHGHLIFSPSLHNPVPHGKLHF